MSVADLLAECKAQGVEVGVSDGRLRVRRDGGVPADLKARLADRKAELLARLDPSPRSWPIDWREEHRLEAVALRRRAAVCSDAAGRRQLLALADEPVSTLTEHMAWGERLVRMAATTAAAATCGSLGAGDERPR
jgi:TubC N-terminal docking domain